MISNISRNNGNQGMKFGQLREYNMRNLFFEKSFTYVVAKSLRGPFLKYQN